MTGLHFHHRYTLPAALSLLPTRMDTLDARAMVLAIALQESGFHHRRQHPTGPARGYWQFEVGGGVTHVLTHSSTRRFAERVLTDLGYGLSASAIHTALEHQDVLACAFARLLLFTVPRFLPQQQDVDEAYGQYLEAWKPGKPRPDDWSSNFSRAWSVILEPQP